jgi:flagellar biosynthetic protein FlhB
MLAPIVVAKGAGEMALQMRTIAKKHSVPIIENKKLARYLFRKVQIDQPVPIDQYTLVAKVLAWAYTLKRNQRNSALSY